MQKGGWVYIMADRYRGGPYVGVTSDLIRRVHQHREGTGSRHVAEYGKTRLVYAERPEEMEPAIAREKFHDVPRGGVAGAGPRVFRRRSEPVMFRAPPRA